MLQPVIAKRLIERLDGETGPHLTERELDVVRLLASGASNQAIAEQLSLSVHTVRFHLQNVYEKLGVQTRTQAVRLATDLGFLQS